MNNIVPGEGGGGVKLLAVESLDGNSKEKTVTYTFFSRFLSGVVEDGQPSNTLFTYYVNGPEFSTPLKPCTPRYKKLKNGMINSLSLKITDQTGKVITDGSGTTIVLYIK